MIRYDLHTQLENENANFINFIVIFTIMKRKKAAGLLRYNFFIHVNTPFIIVVSIAFLLKSVTCSGR